MITISLRVVFFEISTEYSLKSYFNTPPKATESNNCKCEMNSCLAPLLSWALYTKIYKHIKIIYLCIYYLSDQIEDRSHTSLYDLHSGECRAPPYQLNILYRKVSPGDQKSYIALAFKIDIPKEANIEKAVFACTSISACHAPPQYKIYFRTASPTKPLNFLETCQYMNSTDLEDKTGEWEFPSGYTHENGQEVSFDGATDVLQSFVNHASYIPGAYFQLVLFNKEISKFVASKHMISIKCDNQDFSKRPRLHVEWSL